MAEKNSEKPNALSVAIESKAALKIVTDEFLDWEERDKSISLKKHCLVGKY
jgi:hypothetical protein